jgi:DHA2 family methylenomycin A resistance protein-like MFS transporter
MGSGSPSRSGVASGTLNAMRQVGSVLGVAVFGSLIAARGRSGAGMHTALLISVALVVAGTVLTMLIGRPADGDEGTGTQPGRAAAGAPADRAG